MWQDFVPASEGGGGGGRKKRNRSDAVASGAGEAASAIYEEVIRPRGKVQVGQTDTMDADDSPPGVHSHISSCQSLEHSVA